MTFSWTFESDAYEESIKTTGLNRLPPLEIIWSLSVFIISTLVCDLAFNWLSRASNSLDKSLFIDTIVILIYYR
jgi:hypothetical protein